MDNNNKFIEYLEKYNDVEISKEEYKDLLKEVSKNYFNNSIHLKMNGKEFVSNIFENCPKLDKDTILIPKDINIVSDELSSGNILNKNEVLISKSKEIETLLKEYKYLQKSTENHKVIVKKTKNKIIKCEINDINDLIQLINDNEYEEDTEYNIDLESLHKIKDDLIKLNNMIGLKKIKESVLDQMLYFLQKLHISDKDNMDYKHIVLYGPPGTGKTELAKIIGKIYSKVGILSKNIFKKATRSDLIAGYLGQTAIKTDKIIKESLGGVLFIDEAYSLAHNDHGDSYSKECLDVLNEALSCHKDDLMVIIAGYEKELEETIFKSNPGLKSRFIWRFEMEKYDYQELYYIFLNMVAKIDWKVDDSINKQWFLEKKDKFESFGRDIESLLTHIKIAHGRRLYGNEDGKKIINLQDINKGYERYLSHKKEEDKKYLDGLYV